MTENAITLTGIGLLAVATLLCAPADGAVFQQKDGAGLPGTNPAGSTALAQVREVRGKISTKADARNKKNLRQTVRELKKTKYSLQEIVNVLKDDRRKAAAISVACLNNNFNGSYVYAALLNAGFSKKTADAAVPVALRREPLLFPAEPRQPGEEVRQVFIEPNPFRAARASGRRPAGVPHIITKGDVGLRVSGPLPEQNRTAGQQAAAAILWDAARSFAERIRQFGNVSVEEQARFFADCSQDERAKILTQLSAEQKNALSQTLPEQVRDETKPLFQARRVNIEIAQGSAVATQDVQDLINWINAAEKHLGKLGFMARFPAKIIIGQETASEYATAQEWLLAGVSFETIGGRLIQSTLADEYPDLGYQAIEAVTAYYLENLLAAFGMETTADDTPAYYQSALETLDSTTLYQAYTAVREGSTQPAELTEMVRNAATNYRAMAQAIREISLGLPEAAMLKLVREALNSLSGLINPRGSEIAAAFLSAEQRLSNGEFNVLIRERFAAHGILPADTDY